MKNQLNLLLSITKTQTMLARRLNLNGLGWYDFIILYHLNDAPGKQLRRIDLAVKLGLTPSGITRLLLPLEKLGIITSDQDNNDARARNARLTDAGSRLLDEATTSLEMKLEDIMPRGLSHDLGSAQKYLDAIIENILMEEYSQEAKVRWGETDAYQQSKERLKRLTKADMDKIKHEGEELMRKIANAMPTGPESAETQKLIAKHYNNLRHFYDPNPELYRGLGEMYVQDARFTAYFEKFAPGLAEFMRQAIDVFCDELSDE